MAKLGIVYGNDWMSWLTLIFTGSKAYHVIWRTEGFVYDMHLIRRRRSLVSCEGKTIKYFDFPFVTQDYLEHRLTEDASVYGVVDYLLFALKPVYHFFGKSTRNASGIICSEMCNIDLNVCGYKTPWKTTDGPPSPADFERWLVE